MRFASYGGSNTSDYAAAGKAVANSAAKSFAIQRQTGPNYGDLSKVAMQTNSAEKIAGMKASANVAKAGIGAYSGVTKMGQKVAVLDDKIDRANKSRKAGVLAGIGQIAGVGFLAARDNNNKDRKRPTADYSDINSNYKSARDELMKKFNAESGIDSSSSTTPSATSTKTSSTVNSENGSLVSSAQALNAGKGTAGKGGKYGMQAMTDMAIQGGFSPENARTMAAISMGESGGNAGIDTVMSGLDPNKSNEFSVGLSQINMQAHGDKLSRRGWSEADLRDPVKNMTIAKEVYDEAGGFGPWSVFKKGLHKQYLN